MNWIQIIGWIRSYKEPKSSKNNLVPKNVGSKKIFDKKNVDWKFVWPDRILNKKKNWPKFTKKFLLKFFKSVMNVFSMWMYCECVANFITAIQTFFRTKIFFWASIFFFDQNFFSDQHFFRTYVFWVWKNLTGGRGVKNFEVGG